MAKDVVIRTTTYEDVPAVQIPIENSEDMALFVDTSDATLTSGGQMLNGYTAYADGVKYTGNITSKTGSDLSVSGATVTVPAGYYASQQTKSVDNGTVVPQATITGTAATVTAGTNTLTLEKTVSNTPNVSTAGYISAGTAGNSDISLTANVTTKAAATLQPGTSAVTIAAGTYCTGAQTIAAEPNYLASNIVAGKSLWGLNGSAQIPVISQDSTTHILSIS